VEWWLISCILSKAILSLLGRANICNNSADLYFSIHYIRKRDLNDFHHSILGLLFAVLIIAVITDSIKDAVGRPRPDFFWRCFPDGKGNYDSVTGNVICHGDWKVIKEGHKSFPSGHTCLPCNALMVQRKSSLPFSSSHYSAASQTLMST